MIRAAVTLALVGLAGWFGTLAAIEICWAILQAVR